MEVGEEGLGERGRAETQPRVLTSAVPQATAWERLREQEEGSWLLLHFHLPSHSEAPSGRRHGQGQGERRNFNGLRSTRPRRELTVSIVMVHASFQLPWHAEPRRVLESRAQIDQPSV